MCTYNGEKYLQDQINSILKQKGDFELKLIIREDGSSDRTIDILKGYETNPRVKIKFGNNKGPALGFMELLHGNKGYDFYAFSDQDDVWNPDKLLRGISKLSSKYGPSVYFANAQLVDAQLNPLNINVYKKSPQLDFKSLSCCGGILGCTIVFNNKIAKIIQNSKLPQKIIMHDFYVSEVCKMINGEVIYDPKCVMLYRQHENNVIGVSYGVFSKVTSRFKEIFSKPNVGVDEQAGDILTNYTEYLNVEKLRWLRKVKNYNNNFYTRLNLALSSDLRFVNKHQKLRIRFSILMGNR